MAERASQPTFPEARRTIAFTTSHSRRCRSVISLRLRSCVSPLPLPWRSSFRFPRVTHGSLPPDKHNGEHAELPSRSPPPPCRVLSFLRPGGGEIHIKCNIDIHIEIFPISSRVYRVWYDVGCLLGRGAIRALRVSPARSRVWFVGGRGRGRTALYTVARIYQVVPTRGGGSSV